MLERRRSGLGIAMDTYMRDLFQGEVGKKSSRVLAAGTRGSSKLRMARDWFHGVLLDVQPAMVDVFRPGMC
jgi:hypothetical protein